MPPVPQAVSDTGINYSTSTGILGSARNCNANGAELLIVQAESLSPTKEHFL